jgi:hypothetical protein
VAEASASARAFEILASLLLEREALRRRPAERAALEANRLSIDYWRARLSRPDGPARADGNLRPGPGHAANG